MTDSESRAGQEAARLMAAAQQWLRESAPHLAPVGEDGGTCPCPLCRAVAGVRATDPESVARWVDAAVAGVAATLAQAGTLADQATRHDVDADADVDSSEDAGPSPDPGTASEDDASDDGPVGHDGSGGRVRRIRLDGDVGPDLP